MTIAKLNGVAWASIAKANGVAVASIAKIDGQDAPSATAIELLGSAASASNNANNVTASHTLSSGTNRIVIAFVTGKKNGTTTPPDQYCTYDYGGSAIAMHAIGSGAGVTDGTNAWKTTMYYLLDSELPAAGTISVYGYSQGSAVTTVTVYTIQYASQGAPETNGSYTHANNNAASITLSSTTAGAWLTIGGLHETYTVTSTPGTDQVSLADASGNNLIRYMASYELSAGGNQDETYSFSAYGTVAFMAASFAPA